MSNVIDFWEWRRARLGHKGPYPASMRRARPSQREGRKTLAGSDLSPELRRMLFQSLE